jgi:hypothetical protein
MWGELTPEQKQPYIDESASEKAAYNAWILSQPSSSDANDNSSLLNTTNNSVDLNSTEPIIPTTRIRKICKLDTSVKTLPPQTLHIIAKATEQFLAYLGAKAFDISNMQNRRKLGSNDVVDACESNGSLSFLREDLVDLQRMLDVDERERKAELKSGKKRTKDAAEALEAGGEGGEGGSSSALNVGTSRIANFFKSTSEPTSKKSKTGEEDEDNFDLKDDSQEAQEDED